MVIKVFNSMADYNRAKANCPSDKKLLGGTVDLIVVRRNGLRSEGYIVEASPEVKRFKGFKPLSKLSEFYPDAQINL